MIVRGSDLRVGDVVAVWWNGGKDTIVSIKPVNTTLVEDFPEGIKAATFVYNRTGMTIDVRQTYEVLARDVYSQDHESVLAENARLRDEIDGLKSHIANLEEKISKMESQHNHY